MSTPFSLFLRGMTIFLALGAILASASETSGEATVPWLDFARPKTPVDPPIEEVAASLNARGCSKGCRNTVMLRDYRELAPAADLIWGPHVH